jgi:5-(carboxyamino)imidazole ribonucleotide mutase
MSVAIIMGSSSDASTMDDAVQTLRSFGVPVEVRVLSAHRTPDDTIAFARGAAGAGIKVIIAAAGGAAHLAGVVAAATPLPVIGVPVALANLGGLDSLLAMVQMPKGIPVATVAVNGARNSALLAVRILALSDPRLAAELDRFVLDLADQVRTWTPRSSPATGSTEHPGRPITPVSARHRVQAGPHGGARPATASSMVTPSGITARAGMSTPLAT